MTEVSLSREVQELLRCPSCRAVVQSEGGGGYLCAACGKRYPVVGGIPVLLDEAKSVFRIEEICTTRFPERAAAQSRSRFPWRSWLPTLGANIKGKDNYALIAREILPQLVRPRVLVVGGRIVGEGMAELVSNRDLELVETDVAIGPRTALVCDAHDLPFADAAFDLVIIQAVLEHVVDPVRCCAEIHRVLKAQGYVYAETPFMQQVHGGAYDFTRFTHLGHRRLFRYFTEISSGAVCGPGMALAWSYQHFLLSFSNSRRVRAWLGLFAKLTAFPLKYADYYLIDKRGTLDAASGYFFLGEKASIPLSDYELVKSYKGLK